MSDRSRYVGLAIDAVTSYRRARKNHEQSDILVAHAADELGLATTLEFTTAMPPGCWAELTLASFWGLPISSCDSQLFRGKHGAFVARTPIRQQRGQFYLPYGALKYRRAGTYTAEVAAGFLDPATGAIRPHTRTEFKLVLPAPQPWRKVEFLWPLIGLCMAVLRADDEVTRDEVRTLKNALTTRYQLAEHDMEALRMAMKSAHGDIPQLVAETQRRLPHLDVEDTLEFLAFLGRADGPMRAGERAVLGNIGLNLGVARHRLDAVLARFA